MHAACRFFLYFTACGTTDRTVERGGDVVGGRNTEKGRGTVHLRPREVLQAAIFRESSVKSTAPPSACPPPVGFAFGLPNHPSMENAQIWKKKTNNAQKCCQKCPRVPKSAKWPKKEMPKRSTTAQSGTYPPPVAPTFSGLGGRGKGLCLAVPPWSSRRPSSDRQGPASEVPAFLREVRRQLSMVGGQAALGKRRLEKHARMVLAWVGGDCLPRANHP